MGPRRIAAALLVLGELVVRDPVARATSARAAQTPQNTAVVEPLDERQAVERPIAGGERHRYSATLAGGEFLFVVVDQRGIDLAVRLVDGAGTVVAECDSPNGTTGTERIAVVAPRSGAYFLDVSAGTPAAAPGRYAIRVEAHRPATGDDVSHAEAERLFAEAEALRGRNTAENRRAAGARLARAYELFLAHGYRYEAALASFSEGMMHMQAGAPLAAQRPLLAARDLFERRDPIASFVLDNLGGLYDLLGEPHTALRYYQEALGLAVAAGDRTHDAQLHNNIGVVYARLNDWTAALEQYREALATFRSTGDRRREALALNNIGVSYQSARELTRSREFLEQALAIRHAIGDADGEASTLVQLGENARLLGDVTNAIARFEAARQLQTRPRNPVREATIASRLGYAYLRDGQLEKALAALDTSIGLARTAGDRREEALALIRKADTYLTLHDVAAAHTAADAALALAEPLGDRVKVGLALQRRARAYRERDELDSALTSINGALASFEEVRVGVSTPELRATFASEHQDAYADAIDVLMRLDDRRPGAGFAAQALQVAERARARGLLDLLAESGAALRHGVPAALLDRQRELAQTLEAKADRLVALQRGAASAELDALSREVSVLDAEYEELRAGLRRQSPAYASLTQPAPLAPEAIQRDLLDGETTLVEYALGDVASYAWVVQSTVLRAVRLAPRRDIEAVAREAYELLTARGQAVSGETTAARRQRVADADARLPDALRRVSDLVLSPLGDLGSATRLAIVADGALQYLPFETLPVPSQRRVARPLITDFEIVTLPSASTLAVQRQQLAGRPRPARGVAVFADPVFDTLDPRFGTPATPPRPSDLRRSDEARLLTHQEAGGSLIARIPRLRFTGDEAKAILAAAAGQRNFSALGFAADKTAATNAALAEYRYVHFATHGVLDAERPSLSALVLSLVGRDGQPREGFLRAHELYNLDLHADLVVLSACQTGLGKEISGEGIVGLTRGLMYAGASRVIVSLWSVSDRATASLMGSLYRAMLKQGQAPAAALRAAQLTLMRDSRWRQPYYWAAFTLQGEWN